jgi:hypothetical protein
MSCAFCRGESLQKQSIRWNASSSSSTRAEFQILPDLGLTKGQSGLGDIIFQVTGQTDGVLYDNIVVPVHIGKKAVSKPIAQQNKIAGNIGPPPGSRDIDLTITCFVDAGRGVVLQLLPANPSLVAKFSGRHLAPDKTPRVFQTGLGVDTLEQIVARDYADLLSVTEQNAALEKALTGDPTTATALSTSNNQLNDTDEKKLLDTFYTAGRDLYRRLFLTDPSLRDLAAVIEAYQPSGRPLRIRIETQGLYVPWQMLHPLVAENAMKFWGFRYELIVDPQGDQGPGYYPSSMQYTSGPLIFAKYRADQTDSETDKDVAELGDMQITYLKSQLQLQGVIKVDSRAGFQKALDDDRDTVQLIVAYTHAENGTILQQINPGQYVSLEDISGPKLQFAKTEFLSAIDLDGLPSELLIPLFSLKQHPVVFLNGCETGGGGYFATKQISFPSVFLHFGARGVIATDAPVWEMFGYYFGNSLLKYLQTGQPASLGVLNARRDYLRSSKNPLGLLYAYYGGADAAVNLK